MDVEFVIPLNKEDLLSNRAADGYGVRHIYEPSKLGEKLEGNNLLLYTIPVIRPVSSFRVSLILNIFSFIPEFFSRPRLCILIFW